MAGDMNWLRSLAFNIILYGLTVIMCFLMLWALLLPRRLMLGIVHLWLWQIIWVERYIGGITYQVIGRELVPSGACIIAAKH
jgi:1-acyl-sn-glycerol-3-phosphate acyltransferase